MKNFSFVLLAILVTVLPSTAQKFIVKGQLLDSTSVGLPSATIMILQTKDSTLVNFGTSNAEGNFEIKNVTAGDYFLKVSYIGYQTLTKRFVTQAGMQEINLGKISLANQTKLLNEVTVKGEKQPVVVKKDTIEFNAIAFKTKANATVEDLIKKMPGIEVARDGTVTAQGEQVQRVMVDGKEFFGRDPKLATRNLPADAVDKVQVFDKKSDQTVFTGIDDGQREKTMNLELKEEKRHAAFGNSMAGVGSNERWQARSSLNKFNKGNQLSFLSMGNNINEQGFSFGDYANFGGAGGGGGGGGNNTGATLSGQQNGIVTNAAGGINSNSSYNKEKTKVNGSYFYNHLDQNLITDLQRVNYQKEGTYNFSQQSRQNTINDNHRVNLTVDQKIDSFNSVKFNTNFTYNTSGQNISSAGKTWNIGNTALRNENSQTTNSTSNSFTLNSNLLWRHRFAKKGRTLTSNFTYAYTNTGANGNLNSTNHFYIPKDSIAIVSQTNAQSTISPTYGLTLTFTEPLGKRKYLEFDYNITSDINKVSKDVYDWQNEKPTFNNNLSNRYNSNYLYSRPGINFRINRDKYNFTVGTAFQQTMLNGELLLKNQSINRTFQAVLPVMHFNYDFAMGKRLRVDYTTSMQEPSISQLQPIINNSDQLNLTTGNPQLQPAYVNQLRMNFNSFSPDSFLSFFALINGNYTTNAIVSSQTTSQQGVRLTKPVNVGTGASLSGNFSVGIPITPIKSRVNIGPNYSVSRSINLINEEENRMVQQTIGGLVRYNFSLDEILIVDLSANLSKQETSYSFSGQQNQSFFNQTYSSEVNVNFLKNYAFNTEFNFFDYQSATTNFHQTIPLWNIGISRYMLKNKSGELKFGVINLLDKSLAVTQTASTNYLQQQTTNNLGRYLMISFTYILNKQLNPMGGARQRGGGNRMMMFRQ
jgi:hypothetical protein